MTTETTFDAVVVGGGFGGIGAALRLAEGGARVALLERLGYLGGAACTFEHEGDHFEGGATLFAGLGPDELFGRWVARYGLNVEVSFLERPVELRAGSSIVVTAHRDRARFVAELCALPGAPVSAIQRFFALQERVAALLWSLFDDPALLPPLTLHSALRHLARSPRYASLAPLVGRSLGSVLARYGLADFAPLRAWFDAQCQITVQCSAEEAEAAFALAALDYHHRGAAHVHGGIGRLAEGLGHAITACGGIVQKRSAVSRVEPDGDLWIVTARGVTYRTRHVVLNVLPQVAARLVRGVPAARFASGAARVREGWGAAALFRTLVPPHGAPRGPLHLELVDDPAAPFLAGNHVFLSIGAEGEGVADPRLRRATISTHVDLAALRGLDATAQQEHVEAVQARMRATISRRAPEWARYVRELTASPRTYARWVGRTDPDAALYGGSASELPRELPRELVGGWVGGVPRRAGLRAYRDLFQRPPARGITLVGDSAFPGQSVLATALGGVRAAEVILRASAPARVRAVAPSPRPARTAPERGPECDRRSAS